MEMQTEVRTKATSQIERLRTEAAKNPVFAAVSLVFALRQRARQQVTMSRLKVVMAAEGYNYTKMQLEDVLVFLSSIHIGVLDRSARGRIRALKGIKVTLQSLGAAALTKQDKLEQYSAASRFIKLPTIVGEKPTAPHASPAPKLVPKPVEPKVEAPKVPPGQPSAKRQYPASLIVTVDGNDIEFELPQKVTMEQFFKILGSLYE